MRIKQIINPPLERKETLNAHINTMTIIIKIINIRKLKRIIDHDGSDLEIVNADTDTYKSEKENDIMAIRDLDVLDTDFKSKNG